MVIGLDLSNPVIGYKLWPVNGFQANFGVDANLQSWGINPKVSFKIIDQFALGASLNILYMYQAQLNFDVMNAFLVNRGTGTNVGGAFGFWAMINPKNFLDFSFFTPIKVTLHGTSVSGPSVNTNFRFLKFPYLPGTYVLNYTYIFSEKFLGAFKLTYSWWRSCKSLVLKHVAIGNDPIIFILNWKNTFNASIFGRYQATDKIALSGLFGFDESLVNSSNNVVAFPIGNVFYAAIGGEYRFAERAIMHIFLGQGRAWRPKIHNPPGLVDGTSNAIYTLLDIGWTVDF